jgi:hypothetical protein
MRSVKQLLILITALAMPACAFAQANVIENQITFLYVDATSGSDANPGTQAKPFRTIGKAVGKAQSNNVNGIGSKVYINPGIYREFVNIQPTYRQTRATITLQATQVGTAVIAGSDVFTGWAQGTSNVSTYTHAWTPNFGFCTIPNNWPTVYAPITQRREMIFVNGMPLTQVMSKSLLQLGAFYIDEAANTVTIWPSPSTNMAKAVVEVAMRPQTLAVAGRTNMVFRGLVFEHAAGCLNTNSAHLKGSTNILFDSVQANWNNWGGLNVSGSSLVTVQNSVANHNGGVGFGGFQSSNTLFQFDESDYNNWRGAMGAYYDWAMGGTKLFSMHTATVKDIYAYRNQAQGLWFDTDNKNIVATNETLAENIGPNIQVEVNEGPISMTGSTLCSGGVGMNLINSENVTVAGNTFYNNGATNKHQAQIYVAGKSHGRALTDWETGQQYNLYTQHISLHDNTFEDAAPGQYLLGTYLSGADWTQFQTTLSSNNNHWFDPTATKKFLIPNGKLVDLNGWQLNSTEDMASVWATSAQPAKCVVPATTFPDFSIIADNHSYTMVSGKGSIKLNVYSYAYGAVNLSVAGLPKGVTASHSQSSLVSGSDVLTLTASRSAINQTVLLTVSANSGSRVHTVSFYVHVVPGTV